MRVLLARLGALLSLVALALAASGCGVQAYQRGHLAKPKMQLGQDAEAAALEQHVYEYREGALRRLRHDRRWLRLQLRVPECIVVPPRVSP